MILNEKNDETKKVIHLLVTSLCNRNCKYCCNKQYDLNDIPQVTKEELSECETVCLTGGEPFAYSKPFGIARRLKTIYPNIKKVYVYTNAYEMWQYFDLLLELKATDIVDASAIDGYNISLKSLEDIKAFRQLNLIYPIVVASGRPFFPERSIMSRLNYICGYMNKEPLHNRLYIQRKANEGIIDIAQTLGFEIIERPWQKEFVPCDDSIFRRL